MFYVFVQRAEHFVLHHRNPISFGDQIFCFIASDSIVTLCLRNARKLSGQPVCNADHFIFIFSENIGRPQRQVRFPYGKYSVDHFVCRDCPFRQNLLHDWRLVCWTRLAAPGGLSAPDERNQKNRQYGDDEVFQFAFPLLLGFKRSQIIDTIERML